MSEKYCVDCGGKALAHHHFCGACGHQFKDVEPRAETKKIHHPKFIANQYDIAIYNKHREYNKKVASVESIIFYIGFIGAFLTIFLNVGGVLSGITSVENVGSTIGLGAFFIISIIILKFTGLDNWIATVIHGRSYKYKNNSLEHVYKKLPSSKNNKGDSICIFCGNNRFFRKGIYASNSCTVNCTKCQQYLYTE